MYVWETKLLEYFALAGGWKLLITPLPRWYCRIKSAAPCILVLMQRKTAQFIAVFIALTADQSKQNSTAILGFWSLMLQTMKWTITLSVWISTGLWLVCAGRAKIHADWVFGVTWSRHVQNTELLKHTNRVQCYSAERFIKHDRCLFFEGQRLSSMSILSCKLFDPDVAFAHFYWNCYWFTP